FIEDILYMYRQDKVSKIITTKGDYEMKATLKELENRLAPYSFYRIHKSYLINLNYVTRLTPWFNGAYELELAGCDEKLSVSRNYVKGLRSRLERGERKLGGVCARSGLSTMRSPIVYFFQRVTKITNKAHSSFRRSTGCPL